MIDKTRMKTTKIMDGQKKIVSQVVDIQWSCKYSQGISIVHIHFKKKTHFPLRTLM